MASKIDIRWRPRMMFTNVMTRSDLSRMEFIVEFWKKEMPNRLLSVRHE